MVEIKTSYGNYYKCSYARVFLAFFIDYVAVIFFLHSINLIITNIDLLIPSQFVSLCGVVYAIVGHRISKYSFGCWGQGLHRIKYSDVEGYSTEKKGVLFAVENIDKKVKSYRSKTTYFLTAIFMFVISYFEVSYL